MIDRLLRRLAVPVLDTAAGTLPNGFVSASFGGSAYATLAFTGVRGPTSGLGTRIFINHSVQA